LEFELMRKGMGKVYLVGAGPGDPELLTVRALRLLQSADVVAFDRLISDEIMALVPAGVARICVGKAPKKHSLTQDEINKLLLGLAEGGRRVVRLKGGDPFIFGRGGEEAEFLINHGIEVEVVPGITTASGVATGLGIPLTHRGLATGVRYVTGSCRKGETLTLDWQNLADPDTTLVFYMALTNLPEIEKKLIAAGLAPETPAAIVENALRPNQRQAITTLGSLSKTVAREQFIPPSLIIIGKVVAMAERLGFVIKASAAEAEGQPKPRSA
jgi:uroporphyrin-III C-methyltransferase